MAVTKIRKISSWTLLLCSLITVVVLGLFYGGGVVDPASDMKAPIYTSLLLNWTYILFGLAAFSTVLFALWQFVTLLKHDTKSAITGLVVIVLFIGLLFVTYTIGEDTPLNVLNSESAAFNVPFWLKITDMWIYSVYVMVALLIVAIVAGTVKKILGK